MQHSTISIKIYGHSTIISNNIVDVLGVRYNYSRQREYYEKRDNYRFQRTDR